MKMPLIDIVEQAKAKYKAEFGFPAETIHVSQSFERVIHRWAYKQRPTALFDPDGGKFLGLEVMRSTSRTPHLEFWLAAVRDGQVYSQHARLAPGDVGGRIQSGPETITLGGK